MKSLLPRLVLLTLILPFASGIAGSNRDIGSIPEEVLLTFLPIVAKPVPPVEPIETERGEYFGYPSSWWVYGYVNSLVPAPVYSVIVGINVTYYPYCDPDPCEPYQTTEPVYPAFPVTLPGQKNPFAWSLLLGKASASVGQVNIVSWSLSGESGISYYPLTVVDWHREGKAVLGRVRNDSVNDLVDGRAVVFSNVCDWEEPSLNTPPQRP